MKYLKKKKKSILPWLLIALTVVLVVLIIMLSLLPGRESGPGKSLPHEQAQQTLSSGETGTDVTDPTLQPTLFPTQPDVVDLLIETPYVTLVYPGEWSDLIQVDEIPGDPYKVVFTAKLDSGLIQELFTISFGGSKDTAMGMVMISGKEVPVHVSAVNIQPAANWSDYDISVIYSMQETLNDVLAGLMLATPQEEPRETQPTLPPEDGEAMIIDTPAGEMAYPARWEDYLKLEIRQEDVYTLEFYTVLEDFSPVHLFNVYLGGDKGIYVMDLTASDGSVVKLYVDIPEIEPDINWTDAQRAIVFAMQEDMNFLLQKLMQ